MRKFLAYLYLVAVLTLVLVWFWLASLHAAAPKLTIKDVETITVIFDQGAIEACTVFYEHRVTEKIGDPNFPDGHYAPQHCFMLSPKDTGYNDDWEYILKYDDDWDVYASVQYGTKTVQSNKVVVHR